jgi:hypothetical protein
MPEAGTTVAITGLQLKGLFLAAGALGPDLMAAAPPA